MDNTMACLFGLMPVATNLDTDILVAPVHQHAEVNQTHPFYIRKPLRVVVLDVSTHSTPTGRMQFTLVLKRCSGLFPAL